MFFKIFVRAYVDITQQHLYTSSPLSPNLSLDMPYEPYMPSATRPPATMSDHCDEVDCDLIPSHPSRTSLVWVVGPVVAGIGLALLVVLVIVFRCHNRRMSCFDANPQTLSSSLMSPSTMFNNLLTSKSTLVIIITIKIFIKIVIMTLMIMNFLDVDANR